jgi:hypothetical protein
MLPAWDSDVSTRLKKSTGLYFALFTPNRQIIGNSTVSAQTETLGGRLPLSEPSALSTAQKDTYERLNRTWIPLANDVPFQSKLEELNAFEIPASRSQV